MTANAALRPASNFVNWVYISFAMTEVPKLPPVIVRTMSKTFSEAIEIVVRTTMIAGLIACYRGLAVVGGPRSVGEAVNETVVFSFVALFLVNMLLTSVGVALSGN